jgi:hypothetical protein
MKQNEVWLLIAGAALLFLWSRQQEDPRDDFARRLGFRDRYELADYAGGLADALQTQAATGSREYWFRPDWFRPGGLGLA